MIKFFRKIRQQLITQGKLTKYLFYAIGEIVLVVIGILIALQINNNNETKKTNQRLEIYKQSLITELNEDLKTLNTLDSLCDVYIKSINNYVDYYNTKNPDINVLVQKRDSVQTQKNTFNTRTYTIEDLITTGNLSLFSTLIKNAILQLKDTQDLNEFYEKKTVDFVIKKEEIFEDNIDQLFIEGLSQKEHISVKNWKYNLSSKQYRLFNNVVAKAFEVFNYQIVVHERISKDTKALLELLEEDIK